MLSFVLIPFLVLLGIGQYYLLLSGRNLTDQSPASRRKVLFLGAFAGRRHFTAAGWRYLWIGYAMHAAAFAVVLIWGIVTALVENLRN
jgi:hypothetical protein